MLTLKPFIRESWSADGATFSCFPPITFIAHSGFATRILAYTLDSLVRVSRRDNERHFTSISITLQDNTCWAILQSYSIAVTFCCCTNTYHTPYCDSSSISFMIWSHKRNSCWFTTRCSAHKSYNLQAGQQVVPLTSIGSLQTISGTCLTLFSKFFSPFLHSTCSLSVNRQYLALDGVYHPIWAAIPSNSTLWKCIRCHNILSSNTGFSPSLISRSNEIILML